MAQPTATPCTACAGAGCCTSASITPTPKIFSRKPWSATEERAGLSRSGPGQRRRLRQQGRRMGGQGLELDPKLVEAHELMANLALEDSQPDKAVERGRRGAQAFSRRARRHGHSRGRGTSGGPLARRLAREDPPGESRLRRRLRAGRPSPGAQPPLRGRRRLLSQGHRSSIRSSGRRARSSASI